MNFKTPILFLIFNRPGTTKKVFERIREIKPKYLYVAADGPRENHPGEAEICRQTSDLVLKGIDWDCKVKTLFREKNIGCGKAVSEAITWFFENVEMGIILEDDCLPSQSFFHFCRELLTRYKQTENIWQISGTNLLEEDIHFGESYAFTRYGSIWGWATWRRAWRHYDVSIKTWKERRNDFNWLTRISESESEAMFRKEQFDKVYFKQFDTWDYQWVYAKLTENALSIVPQVNLVRNIGFGTDATHTKVKDLRILDIKEIGSPLIHPVKIEKNNRFETLYSKQFFCDPRSFQRVKNAANRMIKSLVKFSTIDFTRK